MKRIAVGCVLALGLVLGSSTAAMAGETRGNGEENENNGKARSACHYSGLDVADAGEGNPPGLDDDVVGMRGNQDKGYHGVQNWGAFVQADAEQFLIDIGAHPGQACRGNVDFEE